MDGGAVCASDDVCDDDRFCNGLERCMPGAVGSDGRGCVAGATPCGAGESCDEATRECGGTCSEPDADGDGHAAIACGGDDCDDTDTDRFPGNTEVCDLEGRDEDCDPRTFGLRDLDGDRIDDARCCNTSDDGTTYCGEDCDDTRRGTNPNVPEVCDGRDNDCDGVVDEEVSVSGFADTDRDLHGDGDAPISGCPGWPGISASSLDCDDSDPTTNGPQTEIFDGKDNDCDDRIDEEVGTVFWYRDTDGDLWGSTRPEDRISSDRPVAGYVLLPYDCDDADPSRAPSRTELCNAIDDDCDPRTAYVIGVNDWEDDDGDGWADAACPGIAASRADCDDTDASTFPGAAERCDVRDNDCDGRVDESCSDLPPPMDAGVPVDSGAPVDSGPLPPADAGVDAGPPMALRRHLLSGGSQKVCFVRDGGQVVCWGTNAGMVPTEATGSLLTPTAVVGVTDAVEVAVDVWGGTSVCAIRSGGVVWCWGGTTGGATDVLGTAPGAAATTGREPAPVAGLGAAVSLAVSNNTACAVDTLGQVWCWGAPNGLGFPAGAPELSPVRVSDFDDAVSIESAECFGTNFCVLRRSGTVSCWGIGTACGSGGSCTTPIDVSGISDASRLDSLGSAFCAFADGRWQCWGGTFDVSTGAQISGTTPVEYMGIPEVADFAGVLPSWPAQCAATPVIQCWGANGGTSGWMGRGFTTTTSYAIGPVSGSLEASELAGGADHVCAATAAEEVYCWGNNDVGQLGDGTTMPRRVPTRVMLP